MSMKTYKFIILLILVFAVSFSCKKDDEVDTEKPVINIGFQGAFPVNCDTLHFGETFVLKMKFSDNTELGSYSIEIHNNFDHHSHSTEVTECELDPIKVPVNPYLFINDYAIPGGSTVYETNVEISIPTGNSDGSFDEGDYHFFINLTDKEGWSTQKGLSIKMLQL